MRDGGRSRWARVVAAVAVGALALGAQAAYATHDSSRIRIKVEPQNATNVVGEQHCVTATVTDTGHGGGQGGRTVAGATVVFEVSGANPQKAVRTTNASGEATFCYTGTKSGTDTILAFVDRDADAQQDANEPAATVTKTYRPGPTTKVTLEPVTATNTVGEQHCVTATATDQFGNPTPNVTILFSVSGANPQTGSAVTDITGKARFCYTGQNAGTDTIRATADTNKSGTAEPLTEPSAVATKVYKPRGPSTLTLSPAADENKAGEQHCVTATATDLLGQPTSGVTIVFSVSGANPQPPVAKTTDASGQATFCYTGKNVGLDVITAFADANKNGQLDAGELVATATKAYTPGAAAKVVVTPPFAPNTVGTQHCVQASVTDLFGNPVPNTTVFFTVTGPNATSGTAKTDVNGNATFCYTGTKAGLDTITAVADANGDNQATVGDPTGVAEKLYHPGVPRTVTVLPPTAVNTVGEQHCVTATAHDEFGNLVGAGHTILFTVTGANPQGPVARTTDASGQATFCYTGTKAGEDVITATADTNGSGTADAGEPTGAATKTYKPGAPATITLAPATATNVAGEQHCVTATVKDQFGNPVPGTPVTFSVSGANTAAGEGVTDLNGRAEFCYVGTKAGTDTITATVTGTTLTATAKKEYRPGPPAIVHMNPPADENTVGDEHCVTATVTDRFGNPVGAGFPVIFTVTGANPQPATTKTTDAASQATFCYTGTKAGEDVITAHVDTNKNGQRDATEPVGVATKTYKPGPPAKVELAPETAENKAGEQHCVTATVTDEFGNRVGPGHPIVFSVSGANPRPQTVVVTDANGQATFCYTGTKAGTDTITAFADNNANGVQDDGEPSDTATKTYKPGPPAIVAMNPAAAVNTAGEQHCVTATVTDEFGNPVGAGFPVIFTVTGANPQPATTKTTDAASQATFCYTGTKAGEDVITAHVDTNNNGQLDPGEPVGVATKTYEPGQPARLVLEPKVATNTVGEEHCVTATVTDAFGNPTPGITVRFSVTGSVGANGSVGTSGSDETDRNGKATFCYTSELPGVNTITAYADTNNNGTQDVGEPADVATKTFVPPASTVGCELAITEGAWIIALNMDKATSGGNAKIDAGGALHGQMEYQDHGPTQPLTYHASKVLSVVCSSDRKEATIFTEGRLNGVEGVAARIRVRDDTEPGRTDVYGIVLPGYASGDQKLQGGNIQIR